MGKKDIGERRADKIAELDHNLTNHKPINDDVIVRIEQLRENAKAMSREIILLTPESREQSLSLTKLEECTMWAVAALARHQEPFEEPSP